MRIVEQRIELMEDYRGEEMLWKIEAACRNCYKSEGKNQERSTAKRDALIRAAVRRGHTSVLEHANFTFRVVTNRGVSHEWVRHRIGCSYSQESTRYCNYGHEGDIVVVWPWYLGKYADIKYQRVDDLPPRAKHWIRGMQAAEKFYLEDLSEFDGKPEESRDFLNNALKTEIVVTMNVVSLRHFFLLRCTKQAHPQIRELATELLEKLNKVVPVLFEDIAAAYLPG